VRPHQNRARLLGVILAGGRSSRFGADKALALVEGKPLIAHVADALGGQCAEVAVSGRAWGGLRELADHPAPGLGPMGGLCAALHHAQAVGFDAILCAPCDLLDMPGDLAERLAGVGAPAVVQGQWLVGLWPATLAGQLEALLRQEGAISARRWVGASGAAQVALPPMRNINRPDELPPGQLPI
jgi:molybdopterin-guanine dinucleotide biosynthesis protein A